MKSQIFPQKLTQSIPKNEGRRFAISDIHGCGKTFMYLVEGILNLKKNDQLFILGDLIDRGENAILLLDYILEKQKEGYQIFVLIGNHERMLLDFYHQNDNYLHRKTIARNHLEELINEKGKIKQKYADFFNKMVFYIELENCFLVHAGFDVGYEPLNDEDLFTSTHAMLWVRKFKGSRCKAN